MLNYSQFSFGKPKSINSFINVYSEISYLAEFSTINVTQAMVELISYYVNPDPSSILNIFAAVSVPSTIFCKIYYVTNFILTDASKSNNFSYNFC